LRISDEIKERGLLDVLRNGIKDSGSSFSLAFFKPNTGFNPETMKLYK
jgi:type I restriction enzyme R subunit